MQVHTPATHIMNPNAMNDLVWVEIHTIPRKLCASMNIRRDVPSMAIQRTYTSTRVSTRADRKASA
ncbi:hypothetical protein DPMN_070561 [Dreissena polymorpha]|uniref:Uncharacterized protein n=1 Tax=Dreissena polymorpha TaxID=45954 RepID=A0A9D4BVR5_DREPO|nr:hypothetical protein DPMN_070561 [Dreissena polymorpha]